jgi:hypothetical protein
METMTEPPRDERRAPIPPTPCEAGLCNTQQKARCHAQRIVCRAYKQYTNTMRGDFDLDKVGTFKDTWCAKRCKKRNDSGCLQSCARMRA